MAEVHVPTSLVPIRQGGHGHLLPGMRGILGTSSPATSKILGCKEGQDGAGAACLETGICWFTNVPRAPEHSMRKQEDKW